MPHDLRVFARRLRELAYTLPSGWENEFLNLEAAMLSCADQKERELIAHIPMRDTPSTRGEGVSTTFGYERRPQRC